MLLAGLSFLPQHLEDLDAAFVDLVHHELIAEAKVADSEETKEVVEAAMIGGMLTIFPAISVNGLVEAKIVDGRVEAR